MEHSSSNVVKMESPIKLIKMKPSLSENFDESVLESILAFKKTITNVTDKYVARIKIDPASGGVPTFVRIVIKLLVDLVGVETFSRLVKKSFKRTES
jgi:hypothetical protein